MPPEPLFVRLAPLSSALPQPHPLLVLLHGRGSDEQDLLGLVPALDPRFLIAGVRAPLPFAFGGYTWCDLDERMMLNDEQFALAAARLTGTLDDLCARHPADAGRIYLLGFSMGAMLALATALASPGRVRGGVAHSGFLPDSTTLHYDWSAAAATTAFFLAHGSLDPIVPVERARQSRQRLEAAGARVQYREYPIPHTISDESLRDLSAWLTASLEHS